MLERFFVSSGASRPTSSPAPASGADGYETPFLVLKLKEGIDPKTIDGDIARKIGGIDGPVIAPLGNRRYAVARTVSQELLAIYTGEKRGLIDAVRTINGIERANLEKAALIGNEYRNRVVPPHSILDECARLDPGQIPWHLSAIQAPAAWEMLAAVGHELRAPKLAYIGSGYSRHEAFEFRNKTAAPNIIETAGVNFVEMGCLPLEPVDHVGSPGRGTRVLSVVCGSRRFCPGAYPGLATVVYRVADSALVDRSCAPHIARALRHAIFDAACDVILFGCGDPCSYNNEIAEQLDAAYDNGVIVVAPAGEFAGELAYPARHRRTIAVSGIGLSRRPWSAASRGLSVDVSAPATEIFRADTVATPQGERFIYRTGGASTAYAAAQTAAAAAIWLAFANRSLLRIGHTWRLVEAFRSSLRISATKPSGWDDRLWGAGILNVAKLLAAEPPDPTELVQCAPTIKEPS